MKAFWARFRRWYYGERYEQASRTGREWRPFTTIPFNNAFQY